MGPRRLPVGRALPLLICAVMGAAPPQPAPQPPRPAAHPEIAIVVHKSNPVERLTASELRQIFLLERQTWPHGRKITVVLREKGQPERADALEAICDLGEDAFERHILFLTFRGAAASGPREIRSAAGMLRFVFNAPGAIGHVYATELDDSTKVVRIDGRLPGEAGYPLKSVRRKKREP